MTNPLLSTGATRRAAEYCLRVGLTPVPLRPRSKAPQLTGWQQLQADAYDLEALFPPNATLNIGLLLGEPSRGKLRGSWGRLALLMHLLRVVLRETRASEVDGVSEDRAACLVEIVRSAGQ